MFTKIHHFCQEIEREFDFIPKARKEKLRTLSSYILHKFAEKKTPQLVVVCTHNSRRSHLGQIWLAVGADYYQLPEIQTFSGGTEATAFNKRAIHALQRIGFHIAALDENKATNPVQAIKWKAAMRAYQAFSKKKENLPNPTANFAAIMVCSEADAGCPIVGGADFRLALPYDDPKAFDDTELAEKMYDDRARQIGREMLFVLHQTKHG